MGSWKGVSLAWFFRCVFVLAVGQSGVAAACVCAGGSVQIWFDGEVLSVPQNAVFYLHEGIPGSATRQGLHVEDMDGILVETVETAFAEYGGGQLVQWRPRDMPDMGSELRLVDGAGGIRSTYIIATDPDVEPPTMLDVGWAEREFHGNTSCGQWSELAVDASGYDLPSEDAPFFLRLRSVSTGLTWHSPVLSYSDVCGGYPHDRWRERMDITLYDIAGNESAPRRRAVPGGFGCNTAGSSSYLLAFALLGLGLVACRRAGEDYCPRAAELRDVAIGCELTSLPYDLNRCEELLVSSCSDTDRDRLDARMDCYDLAPATCDASAEVNACLDELEEVSASCSAIRQL